MRIIHNTYFNFILVCLLTYTFIGYSCIPGKRISEQTSSVASVTKAINQRSIDTVVQLNKDTIYRYIKGDTIITVHNSYFFENNKRQLDKFSAQKDTIYITKNELIKENNPARKRIWERIEIITNSIALIIIALFIILKTRR